MLAKFVSAVLVLACTWSGSIAKADPVACVSDDEVTAQLAAQMKAHGEGHLVADSAAATDVYLDDVSVFFEGNEFRSKASMKQLYEAYYADVVFKSIEFVNHQVAVCGDHAYTHTSDEYTMEQKSDGELISARAEALVTWRLQSDDAWKISAIVEMPSVDELN